MVKTEKEEKQMEKSIKDCGRSVSILALFAIFLTTAFLLLRISGAWTLAWKWVFAPIIIYLCYSTCCVSVAIILVAIMAGVVIIIKVWED